MSNKKLVIHSESNMFGTNMFATDVENIVHSIGSQLGWDPIKKMRKRLPSGYLFRSPKLDPGNLDEIWPTIQNFTGSYAVWLTQDTSSKEFTAYAKIEDKQDATMFAFAHSLFEKWSDEKEKQTKKDARSKGAKLVVNKDGSIKVKVTANVLEDE